MDYPQTYDPHASNSRVAEITYIIHEIIVHYSSKADRL